MKRARIVEVEWTDTATGTAGWSRTPEPETLECVSIGMLIHSCRTTVVVAQTVSEDKAWTDTVSIPRAVVARIRSVGMSRRAPAADFPCRDCRRKQGKK